MSGDLAQSKRDMVTYIRELTEKACDAIDECKMDTDSYYSVSVGRRDAADMSEKFKDAIRNLYDLHSSKLQSAIQYYSYRKKYNELVEAVEMKYDNETRHETALRIIKQNQQGNNNCEANK